MSLAIAPAWIQAITACAGLVGLVVYCVETRKIRVESLRQGAASRRPFLVLHLLRPELNDGELVLENQGHGPAYEVTWRRGYRHADFGNGETGFLGCIAVGWYVHLRYHGTKRFSVASGDSAFYAEYQDAAGKRYWTEVVVGNNS